MRLALLNLANYKVSLSLSYLWNGGSLILGTLIIQILSGIFLAFWYVANVELAFDSLYLLMREVNGGWLLRYIHTNGASVIFFVIYLHMFRALFYKLYKMPRYLPWLTDCTARTNGANGASAIFFVIYLHMFRALFYKSYKMSRYLRWLTDCGARTENSIAKSSVVIPLVSLNEDLSCFVADELHIALGLVGGLFLFLISIFLFRGPIESFMIDNVVQLYAWFCKATFLFCVLILLYLLSIFMILVYMVLLIFISLLKDIGFVVVILTTFFMLFLISARTECDNSVSPAGGSDSSSNTGDDDPNRWWKRLLLLLGGVVVLGGASWWVYTHSGLDLSNSATGALVKTPVNEVSGMLVQAPTAVITDGTPVVANAAGEFEIGQVIVVQAPTSVPPCATAIRVFSSLDGDEIVLSRAHGTAAAAAAVGAVARVGAAVISSNIVEEIVSADSVARVGASESIVTEVVSSLKSDVVACKSKIVSRESARVTDSIYSCVTSLRGGNICDIPMVELKKLRGLDSSERFFVRLIDKFRRRDEDNLREFFNACLQNAKVKTYILDSDGKFEYAGEKLPCVLLQVISNDRTYGTMGRVMIDYLGNLSSADVHKLAGMSVPKLETTQWIARGRFTVKCREIAIMEILGNLEIPKTHCETIRKTLCNFHLELELANKIKSFLSK